MDLIYTAYAPEYGMTFIMKDVGCNHELESTECIGWYYGAPDPEATEKFAGKLKAEYDPLDLEEYLWDELSASTATGAETKTKWWTKFVRTVKAKIHASR